VATALENAKALGLDRRYTAIVGDWLAGVDRQFDLIVSNPPYIPTADLTSLSREVVEHDPMLALDGALDEVIESVFQQGIIPLTENDPHVFNVRVKSDDGLWGKLFRTTVHGYLPFVTDSLPSIKIAQAEYFWDTDPGEGSGTPLLALDGNINEVVEGLFETGIDHPMPCGIHKFNIRSKSEDGNWGLPFSSVIFVEDTIPVTPVCQDITVQLDPLGMATIDSNAIDDGSTDNCQIIEFAMDTIEFDCSDIGDHILTMSVTDFGGFTGQCSAIVTVQDTLSPVAICRDLSISLDASGTANIIAEDIDNGSYDVCGIQGLQVSPGSFSCNDIGSNAISLTVTDIASNSDSCTANITVVDTLNSCVTCTTQEIPINTGWNMISSYVIPDEPLMDSVFSDISGDIIIVKDGAGAVYLPSILFNQIINWDVEQGYKVKAAANQTLSVGCSPVDPASTQINLSAGWSIVSYLRDNPMDAEIALASLGDTLIIAKNNSGKVFIPSLNFDNINDMLPGQGYQVKLNAPATLTYPANTARVPGSPTFTQTSRAAHYALDRNTGNNSTVIIPHGSIGGLEYGDEIGVFNNLGSLTGSAVYEDFHLALTVWGTDALTGGNENMTDGEPYRYRIWRPSLDEEFPLHVEYQEGFPHFTSNGLSYIKSGVAEGLVNDLVDFETQVFVYPNPANQQVNVEVWLPEASEVLLTIHDLAGKEVFHPRQEQWSKGEHILQLDISQLAVGTYYYRIKTINGSFNGSLVKLKW